MLIKKPGNRLGIYLRAYADKNIYFFLLLHLAKGVIIALFLFFFFHKSSLLFLHEWMFKSKCIFSVTKKIKNKEITKMFIFSVKIKGQATCFARCQDFSRWESVGGPCSLVGVWLCVFMHTCCRNVLKLTNIQCLSGDWCGESTAVTEEVNHLHAAPLTPAGCVVKEGRGQITYKLGQIYIQIKRKWLFFLTIAAISKICNFYSYISIRPQSTHRFDHSNFWDER